MEEIQKTRVKEGATLGANCTIVCGHDIGKFSFVGAGAVVLQDVPDYALIAGNPGKIKGWMCQCGVRLHFNNDLATCDVCRRKHKKEGQSVDILS